MLFATQQRQCTRPEKSVNRQRCAALAADTRAVGCRVGIHTEGQHSLHIGIALGRSSGFARILLLSFFQALSRLGARFFQFVCGNGNAVTTRNYHYPFATRPPLQSRNESFVGCRLFLRPPFVVL